MVNIHLFKIAILAVSLGAYSGASGGQSFPLRVLKKFSDNPKHYAPCVKDSREASDCGSQVCRVWRTLYKLDPFVKRRWSSIFSSARESPAFPLYFTMRDYHGIYATEKECKNIFDSEATAAKNYVELMSDLTEWWEKSPDIRVKTNQILDAESLKLYKFIQVTTAQEGLLRVKLTSDGSAPVVDTTFSADCGKFLHKIFKGYGKFTREYKCQAKKWEVLKAMAGKLDWSTPPNVAEDPQKLCTPEIKASLEYELMRMGDCTWSLDNLNDVLRGDTGCKPPLGSEQHSIGYKTCLAELNGNKKRLERNFIFLKPYTENQVEEFESAMFVAQVWEDYASDHLLATSLRMFYIRSLVSFLDLTKYPLMSYLSKILPPARVREISILLRLIRKFAVNVGWTIWFVSVVSICFGNILLYNVDPFLDPEVRSHDKVKQTQSKSIG